MPNVLSPRDLVSRPDVMDETVPHMYWYLVNKIDRFSNLSAGRRASMATVSSSILWADAHIVGQTVLECFTGILRFLHI